MENQKEKGGDYNGLAGMGVRRITRARREWIQIQMWIWIWILVLPKDRKKTMVEGVRPLKSIGTRKLLS